MDIEHNLEKLSVLLRAAAAYASGDLSDIELQAKRLYPREAFPFKISAEFPHPLHLFSPRIVSMLDPRTVYPDAGKIWQIITARENVIRMTSATLLGRTAAESLGNRFQRAYPLGKDKEIDMLRKQMIGYMIKVVMESFGYLVFRSQMQIDTYRDGADRARRRDNYFKSATRYASLTKEARNLLLGQIADKKTRAVFKSITDLILAGKTEYQQIYAIDRLSSWDSL